jgi:SAM-dependent methyltransferase
MFPYEKLLVDAAVMGHALKREQIYGSGPPNEEPNPEVIDLLMREAPQSLLDVGCGVGANVAALIARGVRAQGLEVDPRWIDRARQLERPVEHFDGARLPFPDGAFDCVSAIEVLEHVPGWEALFREMTRAAARTVVMSVPNIGVLPRLAKHQVGPWHLLEGSHVNFFTADILRMFFLREYPNWQSDVSEYGLFEINGEKFTNHVLAVLKRKHVGT